MALPFGRFQWTHLPMGTVVAQDIFQLKLDAIFIGMEGVTGIADDMIIAGKDEMEHDRNFLAFMEKCMENNLTLNSEKIQFKQKQVSFYGHVWSDQGISPDPYWNYRDTLSIENGLLTCGSRIIVPQEM